jgi:hypothetical protein
MGIFDKINNAFNPRGVSRSGTNIRLSPYRRAWHTYWTENGGEGWLVLGSKSRRRTVDVEVPYLFPTRAIARSVAKYMTRTSMVRPPH